MEYLWEFSLAKFVRIFSWKFDHFRDLLSNMLEYPSSPVFGCFLGSFRVLSIFGNFFFSSMCKVFPVQHLEILSIPFIQYFHWLCHCGISFHWLLPFIQYFLYFHVSNAWELFSFVQYF